jgi:DNA topoisomerase I
VRHDGKFVSLKKEDDPFEIDLPTAIMRIENKRDEDNKKLIKSFDEDSELTLLNGRWGPYMAYKGANYKIPKGAVPEQLSYDDCMKIAATQEGKPARRSKAPAAKGATKTESKAKSAKKSSAKSPSKATDKKTKASAKK